MAVVYTPEMLLALASEMESAVLVWPYDQAPEAFKKASPHHGDEDWVIAVRESDGISKFLAAISVADVLSRFWAGEGVPTNRLEWTYVVWANRGWLAWYVAHA